MFLAGINRKLLAATISLIVGSVAAADVIYVDADAAGADNGTSWENAYTSLVVAADSAQSGDQVWVAVAVYTPGEPGGSRFASFDLQDGVAIYGGFTGDESRLEDRDWVVNETILSGDLDGDDEPGQVNRDDNSYHVLSGINIDSGAVLDGFTIRSGNADDLFVPDDSGGGLYLSNSSPTVTNCAFTDNFGRYGACIYLFLGQPTVVDCTFTGNSGSLGGAIRIDAGNMSVAGCGVVDNTATVHAGAISNFGAITLNDCLFENNEAWEGGAIGNFGTLTITGCGFYGNRTVEGSGFRFGGAISSQGVTVVSNSLFSGNEAIEQGGAVYVRSQDSDPAEFTNCTLVSNRANNTFRGAGIYVQQGPAILSNCVLWANIDQIGSDEAAQINGGMLDSLMVNYSVIQGWTGDLGGVGNTGADPRLMNLAGADELCGTADDDARLRAGSSAIDAGDNDAVPDDLLTDLDGAERFIDDPVADDVGNPGNAGPPIVDIGAYEYQADCNGNGVIDSIDIDNGDSDDCNENGVPDECDPPADDCNDNGVRDDCDLVAGTSDDCNSNAVPDECDIAGGRWLDEDENGVPDDCEATVLFVDVDASGTGTGLSWTDAFVELRDALALAADSDTVEEVRAAEGMYLPTAADGDRDATFALPPGVSLYGGYAGVSEADPDERDSSIYVTTLSGEVGDSGSYHVVTADGTDSSAVLDGFTIQGGNSDGTIGVNDRGGAVHILNGSLTISSCSFSGNSASAVGGAIFSTGAGSTIQNCHFEANVANSGGAVYSDSSFTIEDSTFLLNSATGGLGGAVYVGGGSVTNCLFDTNDAFTSAGGLFVASGTVDVRNCDFLGNTARIQGGGLWNSGTALVTKCDFIGNTVTVFGCGGGAGGHGEATFTNCSFLGNTSDCGGGYFQGSSFSKSADLVNCILIGNTAEDGLFGGGAVYAAGDVTLSQCTLAANAAEDDPGGAIHATGSVVVVDNSIIWDNSDPDGQSETSQIALEDGATLEVNYSVVQGWTGSLGGVGNIGDDPLLINLSGDDGIPGTEDDNVRLSDGSPCIDAADNDAVPTDGGDLDDDGDTDEPLPHDRNGSARFIDDPSTDDTGNSGEMGPPVVDMGAYEFQVDAEPCEGDANGDGTVDPLDSGYVLARFGCPVGTGDPSCDAADQNGDGAVDPLDSGFVLARFGPCE